MSSPVAKVPDVPALPRVGDVVGRRWEILGLLGEGGMGHVYKARDRSLGRNVALKLLIPRYLGRREREARIFREAELAQRVGAHPHLVRVLETGRQGEHEWPFLVMELVEGKDLASQLALEGAMPTLRAARIARQIASAVQALHRKGVVHRDVTPMNVLTRGEHAMLIDLSHAADGDAKPAPVGTAGRLTGPHEVPGTHHYMSREQANAAPAQPAMDVYAFGVTLAHMLTGATPRGYDRETFISMQKRGLVESPQVDVRVHPHVPVALAELANECTSREPELRPTMDEVVARLDGAIEAMEPTRVRRAPAAAPPPVVRAEPTARPVSEPRSERAASPSARRRWLMVAMGVALVMLAVAAWWWSHRPAPAVTDQPEPSEGGEPPVVEDVETKTEPPQVKPEIPGVEDDGAEDDAAEDEGPEDEGAEDAAAKDDAAAELEGDPPKPARKPKPRRGSKRPKPAAPSAEACAEMREAAAEAQRSYDWKAVLTHTERRACWSGVERKRLRVLAQLELGRFEACVREGAGSSDPKIVTLVQKCEGAIR